MQWKNKKKNTFVAENARGSHFFCNLHPISEQMLIGEMLEWLKRHAWKACIPLKGIRGSNPCLSAELTGQNRTESRQVPQIQRFVGLFLSPYVCLGHHLEERTGNPDRSTDSRVT